MSARPVVVLEALAARERPTGVAGAIEDLVRALAARDRGFAFVVVSAAPAAFGWLAGVPHWRVAPVAADGDLRRAWFLQSGLPALCRAERATLLHCLQPVAPARPPCGQLVTVHDLGWRALPGSVQRGRRLYYDAFVPPGLRRADLLLASSQATAGHLRAEFPALAPRVRVTPLGTPGWVAATSAAAGAAPTRPYFLFVGTREPRKNLPRLLDAYTALVADRGESAPDLLLVGPGGWLDGPLRERLERPLLRGRVTTRGWCEREVLRALYEGAVALAYPSLLEGFGLPILEAMACGVPVLTASGGATGEVAGRDALLVDPRDTGALAAALARLADDPALRARLREAGPAHASAWSWESTADLTTAAYEEVRASRRPRK